MSILQVKFWCCNPNDIELSLHEDIEETDDYYQDDDDYVTSFRLRVKNNTSLDIESFTATITIYNADGEKLVEQTDRLMLLVGNFAKNEEIIVKLFFTGLDNEKSKELYFSKINDLKATFQFKKIEYTWNKEKEYKNFDPITILEPKLSEDGTTLTEKAYITAVDTYNQGLYKEAAEMFKELDKYKDSYEYYILATNEIKYQEALAMYTQNEYKTALTIYRDLGAYKDSESKFEQICNEINQKIESYAIIGDYSSAYELCVVIDEFDRHELCVAYKNASEGKYKDAVDSGLTTVIFKEGITSIPDSSFSYSRNLEKVVLPSSLKIIGDGAFCGCEKLSEISIPSNVASIGATAFAGCSGLTNVTLPANLQTLGSNAFSGCDNLETVILGNSITNIDSKTFYNCVKLKTIRIPQDVETVGQSAFENCIALETIVFATGSKLKTIGESAFANSGVATFTIPAGVTKIDSKAFYQCRQLLAITIPGSVENISEYLFYNCESLGTVILENGIKVIGPSAFENCKKIQNIKLPATTTTIGTSAFAGCSSITNITIPMSVIVVDQYAFSGCNSLKTIAFEHPTDWFSYGHGTYTFDDPEKNAKKLVNSWESAYKFERDN